MALLEWNPQEPNFLVRVMLCDAGDGVRDERFGPSMTNQGDARRRHNRFLRPRITTGQRAAAYISQCPECGLPMHIARITPAIGGWPAQDHVYQCIQGHDLIKLVERKT